LQLGLGGRRINETAPAPELFLFMGMAPAQAPELWFSWAWLRLRSSLF